MTREDITYAARKVVADQLAANGQDVPEIGDDFPLIGGGSHLGADAVGDLDSLDHVEIVMALEEVFELEVPDDAAEQMKTFGAAVEYLCRVLGAEAVAA